MDELGPYRSFGMLHCPQCFMRTEFVSYDTDVTDVNDAECCICGYVFGRVRDDRDPSKALRGVISSDVAKKAFGEHLRFDRHVLHSTDIDPDLAAAYNIALSTQAAKVVNRA